MAGGPKRRVQLAAITVGVVGAFAPAAGAAVSQGSVGSLQFWLEDPGDSTTPTVGDATAECGPGEHLVGGGFRSSGAVAFSRLNLARPIDDDDSNSAANDGYRGIGNFPTGGPSGMEAQAVCSPRATTTATSSAASLDGFGVATAKARCPGTTSVSAGGGRGTVEGSYLNSSYPYDGADANAKPDDGWAVRVVNPTVDGGRVTANAVCTERPIVYQSADRTLAEDVSGIDVLTCLGPDEVEISGGTRFRGVAGGARVVSMYSRDDADPFLVPGNQISFENRVDSGDTRSLTLVAICAA